MLAHLAGAIHASDDASNPEAAYAATGCASVVDGAAPATAWGAFSIWTPTAAVFTSAPVTATAGTPSTALTLQLQTGGIPTTLPAASTVTVTSSSPSGSFATDPAGPWSPALALAIPAGSGSASFYAQETTAGAPTLTAALNGQVSTQVETVVAAAGAGSSGGGGGSAAPAPTAPAATVTVPAAPAQTVAPAPAPAATFTPPAPKPPAARVRSVAFSSLGGHVHVVLHVSDASGRALAARVSFAVLRGRALVAAAAGTTKPDGTLRLTARPKLASGCYTAHVKSVRAVGHSWDGLSPAKRYCVR